MPFQYFYTNSVPRCSVGIPIEVPMVSMLVLHGILSSHNTASSREKKVVYYVQENVSIINSVAIFKNPFKVLFSSFSCRWTIKVPSSF